MAVSPVLIAQTTPSPSDLPIGSDQKDAKAGQAAGLVTYKSRKDKTPPKPFSRLAVGGGVSLMGGNMQAAINVNRYMNIRGTGNYINYSVNNISVSGASLSGTVNFAAGGAGVDFYPFPRHGFRVSPGALFYNQNQIAATGVLTAGQSFTVNSTKYYSQTGNPLTLGANLGFDANKEAFTMTVGWGNMIPRNGGHWAFPFELGAAFTGVPSLATTSGGGVCTDQAQTQCSSVNGNTPIGTAFQSNLSAQVAKWKTDLNPLKYYPILSFGVTYNFKIR
jgi:hypothetical protein